MIHKILIFRNLIDNVPKNIGLYTIGVVLLVANHFSFEYIATIVGLVAFLFTYSSIYVMNDLFDIAEDITSNEKASRKPLAQGIVTKKEALLISIILLVIGIVISFLLNVMFLAIICMLIFVNSLYTIPPIRLKHTVFSLPLVLIMQFLKILLPWTTSADLVQFPTLFVLSFSLIYLIIFVGYKQNKTIGDSIRGEPAILGVSLVVLFASIFVYSNPLLQLAIMAYLLAGIVYFRDVHLTDKKVIKWSPIYIFLGVLLLVYLIVCF